MDWLREHPDRARIFVQCSWALLRRPRYADLYQRHAAPGAQRSGRKGSR
jgi:hypothetical protein